MVVRRLASLLVLIVALSPGAGAFAESSCMDFFKKGPLWGLLGFLSTPESIRNAERIRLLLAGRPSVRGSRIVGNSDGSAIERYAAQIEKVTGHQVTLSDAANGDFSAGFANRSQAILRSGKEESVPIVNLGNAEVRRERLSLTAAHEATHAWLHFLDEIGEGTPLSVTFLDPLGYTHSGLYRQYMSASEMKTWSQDLARGLRRGSEQEIQRMFDRNPMLPPTAVFKDMRKALHRLEVLKGFSERAQKDLKDAIAALMEKGPDPKGNFPDSLFKETDTEVSLKWFGEIPLPPYRKVLMPLNTKEEWRLAFAMKASANDRPALVPLRVQMSKLWLGKLERLQEFSVALGKSAEDVESQLKLLGGARSLSREEYAAFRGKLARLAMLPADFF